MKNLIEKITALWSVKRIIELITAVSLITGLWLLCHGLTISGWENLNGVSTSISGAIIFGASLIGAILQVKDSKR